jgi:hypothetical protein
MHLGADVCELPAAPAGHLLRRGDVPVVLAVLLASSCGHLYSALPGPRHFLMDFPTGGGEEGREGGAARQDAGAEAEPGRQPRPSPTYASRSVRRRRSVIHPNIRPYSATQCSIKSCSKRIALTPLRPPSRCPSLRRCTSCRHCTPPLALRTSRLPVVRRLADLEPQQRVVRIPWVKRVGRMPCLASGRRREPFLHTLFPAIAKCLA